MSPDELEIESKMTLFKEGTLVKLKSGGPTMTIECHSRDEGCTAAVWFDSSGVLQRDRFHVLGLVLAQASECDEIELDGKIYRIPKPPAVGVPPAI